MTISSYRQKPTDYTHNILATHAIRQLQWNNGVSGNKIKAAPEFMAGLVTRGNQDAYAGYGNDWSKIRKAPNDWAASCLASKDKAYFNFEHEESIGQPNWDLCKGKPWYLLQSYEWGYDDRKHWSKTFSLRSGKPVRHGRHFLHGNL